MGTQVVRFKYQDSQSWGIVKKENIQPLNVGDISSTELITQWPQLKSTVNDLQPNLSFNDVEILAPISKKVKILCQGVNYSDHRKEGALDEKDEYFLAFAKDASSITSGHGEVIKPKGIGMLDYEIELGVLLKKTINSEIEVNWQNLDEYIGALVVANDISARDEMFGASFFQWYQGKSYRTFCPLGPFLYMLDENEAQAIANLDLSLSLNGEVRQQDNTSKMVFDVPTALTNISKQMDMNAGDLLLTGTPGGVIVHATPALVKILTTKLFTDKARKDAMLAQAKEEGVDYLTAGDVITAYIKSPDGKVDLGTQKLTIVDAK